MTTSHAHIYLSRWNSFAQKLDIILDVAKTLKNNQQAATVLKYETAIRAVNTFRNMLVHGVYFVDKGNVEVASYLTSFRDAKTTALTDEIFNEKRALLRTALDGIKAGLRAHTGVPGDGLRQTDRITAPPSTLP